jgi:formyltetrahydrofolate deformylase
MPLWAARIDSAGLLGHAEDPQHASDLPARRPGESGQGRREEMDSEVIVTLTCPDRVGIVAALSTALARQGVNMLECQQFSDPETGRFFMRVQAALPETMTTAQLRAGLSFLTEEADTSVGVFDAHERARVLILVSKLGHCLNDLLYRYRIGALQAEIVGVVSNHPDFEDLVASYKIPFHYLPVTSETRATQEARILELVETKSVDVVVLARYMQILSEDTTRRLWGKAINIHHSFLPSFKGARPYHQAYARGVKLVGSTAHYVTTDLDEGPIIEQETARVDHADLPERLVAMGRDIECTVLARALGWHLEHRVFMNGNKTVVFK